jgi:acyl-CoA thioesterase-1
MLGFAALVMVTACFASAQEAKKKAVKKAPSPVLAKIEDVPGLPRVLLIGDSISMGYTLPTRALLKGVANVHRPATNCGPTIRGVQEIDKWLEGGKWDVIHFNFGLHDLKYMDEAGKNTSPEKGHLQVPLPEYEKNLEILVTKMERTGARLIFATTTPVPEKEPQRKKDSDQQYNAAAREVMKRHHVAIDDLDAFVRQSTAPIQLPNNVHFTPAGYEALAGQVAASIRKALPGR